MTQTTRREQRKKNKNTIKPPKIARNKGNRNKDKKHKLTKTTKLSFSAIAVIFIGLLAGGIFFYNNYFNTVQTAIDAGQSQAKKIQESDFKQHYPTTILDSSGNTIQELKTQERDYMTYEEMDPLVSEALISIEDRRFYEHHGVDTQGLLTVGINAAIGRGVRGASTITQQLVKNIYLTPEVSISRKVEEMVIAQQLEKKFSKHKILEYYLNNVYFGHGAYGINAASKVYFDKNINDTTLLEKATLIGVTNNPSIYDPAEEPKESLKRARLVLKQMYREGYITQDEYDQARKDKLEASVHTEALNNEVKDNEIALALDSATKTLMEQQDFRFQYQFDSTEEEAQYKEEYQTAYNKVYQRIISGGYEIKTKINQDLHNQLQGIVSDVLAAWPEMDEETNLYTKQAAMTVIDNTTGEVVASIGGRGEEGNSYNRAFLSDRQPGSAIKPLVSYGPAYERGLLETTTVSDDRPNNTYPNNVYQRSLGDLTLRNAMAISSNVVAYKLAIQNQEETNEPVYQQLAQMEFGGLDVADNNPIIAVGGMTYGATTQEMAGGIATLVNQGNYRTPTNIETINRKDNEQEIYNSANIAQRKVYSDDAAYLTIDSMKGVHQEANGTAADTTLAYNSNWAIKTGTTDDAKDLWTVGATPYYTVAVWIGDDTPAAQNNAVVGKATRTIFQQTMDLLNNGKEDIDFTMPSSVTLQNGQLVTRSSQTKQVLAARKSALQASTAAIDTAAKKVSNQIIADKLDADSVSEANTFSNTLLSEQLEALSDYQILVTDTEDNWSTFDRYAQQIWKSIQQIEPRGGSLSTLYTNIYKSKEAEYQQAKSTLNDSLSDIDDEIKQAEEDDKTLDSQIKDIQDAIDEARGIRRSTNSSSSSEEN
ncbi:transglycosylase domain-containing protein [Enterococcus sp. ALS3]|uniref:Transglycosylase domain-containing protein n=1 Tax=Enterococcus alishanensis TaxID=1303817 RepID=A0ABS6TDC6_9ENTE|nr:transglycosylase domain-containing protein [Enterococcus alishanensis]MBV7390895.1 transglycosylase domain-containing protein [Enterococcus alishanensis]